MSQRLNFSGVLQDDTGCDLAKVGATLHFPEHRCVLLAHGADDLEALLGRGRILKGHGRWRLTNGQISGHFLEFDFEGPLAEAEARLKQACLDYFTL